MAILDDELKVWVGATDTSVVRVGVIIASERARGIWARASGKSKTCPFIGRAAGSRPSCLSNTSVGSRQRELDGMIGDMFVQGVSQARVGVILETLNGVKPSPSTVSRVFHTLEEEYQQWKTRTLPEYYSYVFADGTFFSVIYDDEGHKTPVLGVFGITPEGKREVIAMTIGQSESRDAWGNLLDDIKSRGVKQVDLWIIDGNQTMIDAINQRYPDSLRQRCVKHKHKMENILVHVPDKQADSVGKEFMAIFYQKNREKAELQATAFREKHRAAYPEAIACMDRDWEACLTFYRFPERHWSRIRTTNAIERLFLEIKKRSKKMAAPFRNEGTCMLLVYAVMRELKFQNVRM